jgi:hypothetical protein
LLSGGDKGSQTKDIAKAQTFWKDYQAAQAEVAKDNDKKEES